MQSRLLSNKMAERNVLYKQLDLNYYALIAKKKG